MIEVKHLEKFFNKGKKNQIHVLNDVSLQFPEKGLVVLLGASGSGKTTLLNVIGGLDSVKSGEIDFYNQKVSKYHASTWDRIRNEHIGYIFQNYYLMPELSVFDNVAFVLKMIGIKDQEEITKRVEYILKQVNMYPFRKKKATQLSGGQQQRVAIARALVKNPKVIIADEPTGNLDSKNTLEIMNIIKMISVNKLVILVTHEKEIANFYGDRIISLSDGKITGDVINDSDNAHNLGYENTIYLKDLNQLTDLNDHDVSVKYYSDSTEHYPLNVKFIIRNKTLYLDLGEYSDKVKVLDSSSHIELKDEHFKAKTKQELLQTSFDTSVLDHQNLTKSRSSTISFKNSLWIAFKRLITFGTKGRLMLFIFMISGLFVAFSTYSYLSLIFRSYDDYLTKDENYIVFEKGNHTYTDLTDALDGISFEINVNQFEGNSAIVAPHSRYDIFTAKKYEYSSQLNESDLMYGELPSSPYEIVLSYGFYSSDELIEQSLTPIGIWSAEGLINEKITFNFSVQEYTVVGIAKAVRPAIFFRNLNALTEATSLSHMADQPTEQLKSNLYSLQLSSSKIAIYAENHQLAYDRLENAGFDVAYEWETAKKANDQFIAASIASVTGQSIAGIALALIGFYFIMRSSMINRIYEIAVYRALGVRRSELLLSFSIEIILITTFSSFIGFLVMTNFIASVASSPIDFAFNIDVNPLSFLIGVVVLYGVHILVGLLPMFLLLRKTPANILTVYDM